MHQRGYLSGNYLLTVLVMRMLMIIIIIGWFSIELQCSIVALIFCLVAIFPHPQTWIFYSYRAYRVRKCLEVIYGNYHLHLPPATNQKNKGEQLFSWKYYQRTKQWDIKIIKADKGYEYIPLLIANILHARLHDVDILTRNISLNASDPRHCWPQSIAVIPPPPTAELRKWQSRFSLPAPSKSCEPEKGDL